MADLLKTLKGAPCRVLDGYTFVLHRYRQAGRIVDWRCSKYKTCPSRAVSSSKEGELKLTAVAPTELKHTHVADPHSPEKRHRRSVLKEAAASNRATPSMSLAADAHEGLADEAIQTFASQRALQQAVNRVRKIKGASDADKPPSELVLPEEMTKTLRGDRFLFADTQTDDPEKPRILVFLSDYGIELMRNNRDWCVDGTFYAAAKHFRQLLTINVLKNESSLLAAYILLQGSSEETYDRALSAIFDDHRMNGIAPASFIAGTDLSIHLLLNNTLMALGYLPTDEVEAGFHDVCQALHALVPSKIPARYKTQLNAFAKYLNETYIGRPVRNRAVRPRYHPSSWNYFRRTLQGLARTNNAIEGWHAALNSLFPKSSMPMSQFFIRVQKEEERTRNLAERNRRNPAEPLRGRRSATSVRENNLVALVEEYADKELACRDRLAYLRLVQAHLSQQAFARLMEQEQVTQLTDENATPGCSQSSSGTQPMELPESSQEVLEYMAEAACSSSSRDLTYDTQVGGSGVSQCATATAHVSVGRPLGQFSAFDFFD